jgi:hypothetical protein
MTISFRLEGDPVCASASGRCPTRCRHSRADRQVPSGESFGHGIAMDVGHYPAHHELNDNQNRDQPVLRSSNAIILFGESRQCRLAL